MIRFYVLLAAALAALSASVHAQGFAGRSAGSILGVAPMRDSIRVWHRYTTDSTVILLIPRDANPWLRRSYEFLIPIGAAHDPVNLSLSLPHRDSLSINCVASDHLCYGYRLLFCREGGSFNFRAALDFQIFRSGVERVCRVPLKITEKADRLAVSPKAGAGLCSYIYHRKVLASVPQAFTLAPFR